MKWIKLINHWVEWYHHNYYSYSMLHKILFIVYVYIQVVTKHDLNLRTKICIYITFSSTETSFCSHSCWRPQLHVVEYDASRQSCLGSVRHGDDDDDDDGWRMKDETWHKQKKLQPSSLLYSYKYSFILTSEIGFTKKKLRHQPPWFKRQVLQGACFHHSSTLWTLQQGCKDRFSSNIIVTQNRLSNEKPKLFAPGKCGSIWAILEWRRLRS